MGGVNDGGVGISSTPSLPQSSDLEKTQAKLRQTFTAAEKFRRELDFLQKGGDPLDLKTRTSSSVSIQSTSLSDPHTEQFVTSEAKGSFAVTASPHEDSVESSGRLGASVGEPNSADNLMLFDGNNQFREVERRSAHPHTNNNALSEHYSKLDVGNNVKESGESAALQLPKKSYRRRVRSRPNRDGARSSSTDAAPSRGGQSFFPSRHTSRDAKVLVHDADNQEQNCLSNSNAKPKSPNASVALKNVAANSHSGMELDGTHTLESTFGPGHGPSSAISDANASQYYQENLGNHPIKSVTLEKAENLALSSRANGFVNTTEGKNLLNDVNRGSTIPKGLESESSCTQIGQSLDGNNENELPTSVRNGNSNDKMVNITNDNFNPCRSSQNENESILKEEEGLKESKSDMQHELKSCVPAKGLDSDGCTALETERKPCTDGTPGSKDTSYMESSLSVRRLVDGAEQNSCSQNNLKLATKEHEDSILEEAQIIEAKRKRIAELSVRSLPMQNRRKSHWDFVLEEMSWLANDFAQERLWKLTAAAQISRRVASTSRARLQVQNSMWKQKEVAHTLAEAVMAFWHTMQVKCKDLESRSLKKDPMRGLQGYAMRFLEYNNSAQYSTAQAPVISDLGIDDISWEDHLTEENLFYTVPPGAIEAYRKSIESHLLQCQRTGSNMQEEVNTSGYDAVTDNAFEDDEGETNTYYLPGAFEGSKSSKAAQRKRKNFKSYGARSYEMGADLSFMPSVERNITTQPSVLSGKRPASNLNVSHLTKRVRTASRQRVISPFNAGTSGYIQVPNTTDASSGDTNSFQDEQSFLHGESQIPNNMEAESVGDYENQLHFDSMEASNRPKKKKKTKHPGSTFEHRWQLDSNSQNDQKDQSKRRLETHQFDSNGNSGLFGQHIMKKSKMMRQSLENSSDDFTPLAGSIPSPVASQMSNMSNPNKFMKLLVRDRSRKAKALKTAAGQPGLGSPWSLFEDQALVVLVHDMGPNWELISDAINSTLQFKCIFRKSIECKERHKILMDRNTGDGADSADDSGSSQPYPSTLPGIPEGSARQLFQRLQGPMEEDTLKSHFEKIIGLGQKHYRRTQLQKNDNQDPKQLQQPHSSHTLALSQVCPNNLNGGPVLTPLELCDAIASSPDVIAPGYQGPQSGGLPIPNQGTVAPMLPGSSSTSPVPGSSNVALSNHLSSASAPLNPAVRDGRYGIPRTGSLSVDDQQRIQQYNQMLSARNMQQNSLPLGTDRGVRISPPGNGMGVMNRGMAMARPGFQGITSSSMLNSGNLPMAAPANMHSGAGPGQGNSMLRPREAMHMMRPNQNTDHQRQIMAPELQMQQGLSSNSHHTHHLQGPPNHPAYGMRFVKERQLQQQRLLQQQFATSNAMMPHVQPPPPQQSQIPVSSPQNSTQIQPQSSSSPPVSLIGAPPMAPISQMAQKHPVHSPQGLVRNPQMAKQQQQRQRLQQPNRQHPQQRQPPPPQQQAKIVKGGGGRGMMIHQSLPVDPSLVNGFSGPQSGAEKGVYSGPSGLNPVVQSASLSPSNQKKTFSIQPQKPDTINDKNQAPLMATSSIPPLSIPNNQQKLSNQAPSMASQRMLQNRQMGSNSMPLNNPSQTNTSVPVPRPPSNDATVSETPAAKAPNWKMSESFYDSSAAMSDKATPQTNSGGTNGEHPVPAVNQSVVHRQSSSDNLPNPVGHEAGVQWQQQQQPSS